MTVNMNTKNKTFSKELFRMSIMVGTLIVIGASVSFLA